MIATSELDETLNYLMGGKMEDYKLNEQLGVGRGIILVQRGVGILALR